MKMKKEQVLARMKEDCLVAVVRAKNYEQGEKVVDAIIAGGINFIELTMTMDDGDPRSFWINLQFRSFYPVCVVGFVNFSYVFL